jgi:ketosteroid isomerase-like protein
MNKSCFYFLLLILLISSCTESRQKDQTETWKNEIIQTEREFAAMADSVGIKEAFVKYSADDVAILRGDIVLKGKNALNIYYTNQYMGPDRYSLTWEPDFVDVSASGDMGYTYGQYHLQITDTLGQRRALDGIFHTIWKRQNDGTWKFVWD